MTARFFSFDGIDGGGKSTQQERFVLWLRDLGHEVVVCRDPGSTELGEKLRMLLLEKSATAISPASEMLLYMAARAQLVNEVIRPALAAGKIVVSDRFLLANVVYQGHAGGVDPVAIRETGLIATGGCLPDLTFLFDVPVEVAAGRMSRTLDRIESRGGEYMERVRNGFLAESKVYPARVEMIDATADRDAIFVTLSRLAEELLPARKHGT